MASTPKHNNTLHFIDCNLKKTTVQALKQWASDTLKIAIIKIQLMATDQVMKDDQKALA